ncbi:MAG TPA: DUF6062 family protein [Spirochaetia bacterium]|nr:DUF6062 family protein [Spirochaetia bacterium]
MPFGRKSKNPEHHMTFHHLLEAFTDARVCGLCGLEEKAMRRYFDSILFESVTDPQIRADLRRAHGYCSVHGHYLLGIGAAFDTAVLYQDEVDDMIGLIEGLEKQGPKAPKESKTRKRRGSEAISSEWTRHEHCPACRIQRETRTHYARALLQNLEDESMRRAFESGGGVCLPHLRLILSEARKASVRAILLARQKEVLLHLQEELAELRRKFDYRFSDEKVGEERDSWRRAVLLVNGSPLSFPD